MRMAVFGQPSIQMQSGTRRGDGSRAQLVLVEGLLLTGEHGVATAIVATTPAGGYNSSAMSVHRWRVGGISLMRFRLPNTGVVILIFDREATTTMTTTKSRNPMMSFIVSGRRAVFLGGGW